MKLKHFVQQFFTVLAVLAISLAFPTASGAYERILPIVPPPAPFPGGPLLPYEMISDLHSGPACIQMTLNSCPKIAQRKYHENQKDLLELISDNNPEPGMWFSSPAGMLAALMEPSLSPCGSWIDSSNSNRETAINELVYYMEKYRYLSPVSISKKEYWVAVCGFVTDKDPTTGTPQKPAILESIYWYDPKPGGEEGYNITSGALWKSLDEFWGVPHDKLGSRWHNKYIAIVEPPQAEVHITIPEWKKEGPILAVEHIETKFYRWLEKVKSENLAIGPFKSLARTQKMGTPLLVNAGEYQYYIVPFKNRRMAAIFNAYSGEFEEFRQFRQPLKYVMDPKRIRQNLKKTLGKYKVKNIDIKAPEFKYRRNLASVRRFSPTWQVKANVTDINGKKHTLDVVLDNAGQVFRGLDVLPDHNQKRIDLKAATKPLLLSLHAGTAIPAGSFAESYKAGINIVGDLEIPLRKTLSLRAIAGYNQFKSKFDDLDDTSIVNLNLNLRFSTTANPISLFVEAGPGYYLLKDSDNKFGVNVGCGFNFKLSPLIRFECAAHHNTIFTQDENTRYLHLAAGLLIQL